MNFDEILNRFSLMEKEERLFERKIDGIYFWKLIRIYVFEKLVVRLTGNGEGHPNVSRLSILSKVKEKVRIISLRLTHNAFRNKSPKEYLVFRHRRRVNVDGKYVEVNTDYLPLLCKDLTKENTEYVETNIAFGGRNIERDANFLIVSPLKLLVGRLVYKRKLKRNIFLEEIKTINKAIEKYFGVFINSADLILKNVVWYRMSYGMYRKYIEVKKPKKIYLVCSYGKEALIQAARDLSVPTAEIQHGVISKYHMGYSFDGIDTVPYFPDQLLSYGEYWSHAAKYPIARDKIQPIGNPYLEKQVVKYSQVPREERSMLVISSGNCGKRLSEIATEFADKMEEYRVYYKMHPSEFSVWKTLYPCLKEKERGNLTVIEDEINIYELFAKCKYVLGVNSTALYESLAFSPSLILCNCAGGEYMRDLIDVQDVPIVNSTEELKQVVSSYISDVIISRDYFYKNVNDVIKQ